MKERSATNTIKKLRPGGYENQQGWGRMDTYFALPRTSVCQFGFPFGLRFFDIAFLLLAISGERRLLR